MAIDVTCPHLTFEPDPTTEARPIPQNTLISEAHLQSIRSKFLGPNHEAIVHSLFIPAMLHAGTTIVPFSVDPLGGLGPTAHALLFGTQFDPPPPLPKGLSFQLPHANLAYQQYKSLPTGILNLATSNWIKSCPKTLDPEIKAFTPTKWARQSLGLNLVTALAKHLHRALHKVRQASAQATHTRTRALGIPFRASTPHTILDPCPGFLQVTPSPPI